MPAETVASSYLSNATATPVKPNPGTYSGRIFRRWASVATTTGKTSPSYYGMFRVPSRGVPVSCELTNDALSTSVTADIGLWEISNPFAPITQAGTGLSGVIANAKQFFGSGTSMSSAATKTQILYANSAFVTTTLFGQAFWQLLGLTVDPSRDWDLVVTSDATITAGGNIIIELSYLMPSS